MSNQPTVNSPCNLCDSDSFERVSSTDRKGKSLETVVCTTCGLVRNAEIPTDEQLAEFYGVRYRQEYHGETKPSNRRVMRAWNNADRIYQQIQSQIPSGGKVVEVGAGIGCTVKRFSQGGFDAWGVEPHVGFCDYARGVLHSPLENESLEDIAKDGSHDLALLVHVIEHFNSPRESLTTIRRLLKPDGMLYVECPNLSAPFATNRNLFHYAHVHNFTPETLASMAERCGYQVEKVYSTKGNPNLQMLLRRSEVVQFKVNPQGVAATWDAIERSKWAAYHLRAEYIRRRVAQLAGYAHEHLIANKFVANLLSRVESEASESQRTSSSKRAA